MYHGSQQVWCYWMHSRGCYISLDWACLCISPFTLEAVPGPVALIMTSDKSGWKRIEGPHCTCCLSSCQDLRQKSGNSTGGGTRILLLPTRHQPTRLSNEQEKKGKHKWRQEFKLLSWTRHAWIYRGMSSWYPTASNKFKLHPLRSAILGVHDKQKLHQVAQTLAHTVHFPCSQTSLSLQVDHSTNS